MKIVRFGVVNDDTIHLTWAIVRLYYLKSSTIEEMIHFGVPN